MRQALFPEHPRAQQRRDRVLAALFALLCVVLVLRAARKEAGVLALNQGFGERFLAGEDPYFDAAAGEHVHGPYPPSFALVCAPLALLPARAARVLWAGAQCAALLLLYRLSRRRLARHAPALAVHAPLLYALALLLVSRFVLRDMAAGGGNLIYGSLAYASLELALAERPRLAGLPLGFVLAVKPNLMPLLLWLVLRKRWKAASSAVGWMLVLFALPALVYGPARYAQLAAGWARDVTAFAALEDLHDSSLVPPGMPPARNAMNQSLRSAVHRLTRPPGDSGAPDVSVVTVAPRTSSWIARGLALALLLACARAAWRARQEGSEWLSGLTFFPLALLLSPITWKAHGAALLPFVFALVSLAPGRRGLTLLLVLFYVLANLLSEELVGKLGKEGLQALSVFTWGVLALMIWALVHLERAD